MFTNLNTDPSKKLRLLGELGDLSHARVSSSEFKYIEAEEVSHYAIEIHVIF